MLRILLCCLSLHISAIADTSAESNFHQCIKQEVLPACLDGFYKVPDFLNFKGGYVYVFVHNGKLFAYGVKNLDGSTTAHYDIYNPDKSLRSRLDKEVIFLQNLAINDTSLYGGTSYNFQNGSTYYTKGKILANGDLHLDFALDSYHILGKSFLWQRLSETQVRHHDLRPINKQQALETLKDK